MRRIASAALSPTTVVIGHKAAGGTHLLRCLTVSGTDITSTASLDYADLNYVAGNVCALDSTRALALMAGRTVVGNNDRVLLAVLTASGGGLTMGPVNSAVTDGSNMDGAAKLDSTRVVFGYKSGTSGLARIAVVSGTSVTVGPAKQFEPAGGCGLSIGGGDATNGGIASLGGGKFVMLYKGAASTGRLVVGIASGTDITFGSYRQFINYYSYGQIGALDSGKALIVHKNMDAYPVRSRAFTVTVSGLELTEGAETAFSVENGSANSTQQINALAIINQASFFAFYSEWDLDERRGKVGQLALSDAGLTGGAGYPSVIGDDRVVFAMWAKNLTAGSSAVAVERGYDIEMTSTSISLGGATATWDDAGISSLMSTMNDGSDHLLVLDFENDGTDWTLSTSVDGAGWVAQGVQNSGSQAVASADTAPDVSVTDPEPMQWVDELVMWTGDKTTFDMFTGNELANLNDLADTFGEEMDKYGDNYDAPICWQATATMPDGTAWRDSGSGPCPAVVRVPKGSADVVVTDDGRPASPRIVEG